MTPRTLYRVVATAEMITWTLLIAGMVLKYTGVTEVGVRIGGTVHGIAFLAYVLVTIFVGLNQRWSLPSIVIGLATAVVPWCTWPYERWLERNGRLEGPWSAEGTGLRGWLLRHPIPAVLLAMVVVAAATTFLLWLGPPTEWGTRFD